MQEATVLFDMVSTIEATLSAAVVAAVASFALSKSTRGRLRVAAVFALWFVAVVATGATGALGDQHGLGVPGLGIAVLLPIAALCFAFLNVPAAHQAMLAIPLPALIAVNTLRLFGISFLLLYSVNRLPAPFAPVAGWGDILVGVTAVPVAWVAARRTNRGKPWIAIWNLIGFIDLIAAVGLGATSTPGPMRLFTDAPGSSIMTTLPWIIIPCFLVPSFEALHVAIFYRLLMSGTQSRAQYSGAPATG
jgi:hypothetical protein